MLETRCDILIVGGGVGGTSAALSASASGFNVVLTEEYRWIGGQLTSQGVPPDEHPWIESVGCTGLYRAFRNRVRARYEALYPLGPGMRGTAFNPGGGFVSGLCLDPRLAHDILCEMLAEPVARGTLRLKTSIKPIEAVVRGDRIESVSFQNKHSGEIETIHAKIIVDCTELGDLLPLTGAEYASGAEARIDTGELHGADVADSNDVQGLTWCLAVGYDSAGSHVIERPSRYDFWRNYRPELTCSSWPGNFLDWLAVDPISLSPRSFDLFALTGAPYNSLWNYRKIVSAENLGVNVDDVTLVNWPQNDYFLQNIIDQPEHVVTTALDDAQQLSLSLLYWMQTEAPCPDGGTGYPGLYPAPDMLGTSTGLAMAPYIRESRRIKALFTVTEAHVGTEMRQAGGFNTAQQFDDTVGIGCYRIDLHPTPAHKNYIDLSSLPFQIPLGSLIPVRLSNLIAGGKNIGVTHITNGCYRLHPVEWNIGEAAGHLAAFSLANSVEIREVYEKPILRRSYQDQLVASGIELAWPDDIVIRPR